MGTIPRPVGVRWGSKSRYPMSLGSLKWDGAETHSKL